MHLFFLALILLGSFTLFSPVKAYAFNQRDDQNQKIFKQEALIQQASEFVRRGNLDEAIANYNRAIQPDLLIYDYDSDRPKLLMAKVLKLKKNYEQALKVIVPVINQSSAKEGNWSNWTDQKYELQVLIKARNTKSPQPIYDHIAYLKKTYKKWLPPIGFTAGLSDNLQATIIRLYDHAGDQQAGIDFTDSVLKYALKKYKQVLKVKVASDAYKEFKERKAKRDKLWRAYQLAYEFLMVREAFEKDKAENFKGCIDAKPGDTCMGNATKYIIQSDFFPW